MIGKNELSCPDCGKRHELDKFEEAAESFADQLFEDIWKQGKSQLKEMSKKEVAEQMYYLGVKHFMEETHNHFEKMVDVLEKKEEK
jgi:hypothetical protein